MGILKQQKPPTKDHLLSSFFVKAIIVLVGLYVGAIKIGADPSVLFILYPIFLVAHTAKYIVDGGKFFVPSFMKSNDNYSGSNQQFKKKKKHGNSQQQFQGNRPPQAFAGNNQFNRGNNPNAPRGLNQRPQQMGNSNNRGQQMPPRMNQQGLGGRRDDQFPRRPPVDMNDDEAMRELEKMMRQSQQRGVSRGGYDENDDE